MKKIWPYCFYVMFLAACIDSKDVAADIEVRLIQEPRTGACFVVVALGRDGRGSVAVAPSPCPAPAPAEAPAPDGGVR